MCLQSYRAGPDVFRIVRWNDQMDEWLNRFFGGLVRSRAGLEGHVLGHVNNVVGMSWRVARGIAKEISDMFQFFGAHNSCGRAWEFASLIWSISRYVWDRSVQSVYSGPRRYTSVYLQLWRLSRSLPTLMEHDKESTGINLKPRVETIENTSRPEMNIILRYGYWSGELTVWVLICTLFRSEL